MPLICPHCSRACELSSALSSTCPSCGSALPALTGGLTVSLDPEATGHYVRSAGTEAPLEVVGGYKLLHTLGSGGMGTVYEAEEVATGLRVALKLIWPEFAGSAEAVDRFRREGRFASTVTHPRCVFVKTADEDAGRPYIVLELMPGDTLKDLLDRMGPLPPEEAVPRILDVIEGLEALHQRGIIHRDVKPGNCSLEPDGRVKVGDFGLALSLLGGDEERSKFAGTPLFASPEQHRGEELDTRTDVYSVCATLYYLLTGRPPFPGRNLSAVLKRMAEGPADPLRAHRTDLPAALDRVVLRGLERDRSRRWQDLHALKVALLRFQPGRRVPSGVWVRVAAYLIDSLVVFALSLALFGGLYLAFGILKAEANALTSPDFRANICSGMVNIEPVEFLLLIPEVLYFGLLEGLFGCALGKWLLNLRVTRADPLDERAPGLIRVLWRTALFLFILRLPRLLFSLGVFPCAVGLLLALLSWWNVGGGLLLLSTMRQRNGYRGPHDFLSGLRVQRIVWPHQEVDRRWLRRPVANILAERLSQPRDLPAHVGPFRVRRALLWQGGAGLLLAEDDRLGRSVWLWVRHALAPALPPARREVNRLPRLRWLAEGTQDPGLRWDAFVARNGCPLPELVGPEDPLSWEETRTLLAKLAEELATACAEQTVPPALSPAQVWVQADGEVFLVDPPLEPRQESDKASIDSEDERSLALLRRTAVLSLEGKERPAGELPAPVRAPLPLHASALLGQLLGLINPYERVEAFRADLAAHSDYLPRVTRVRRLLHILIQMGLFLVGFLLFMMLSDLADHVMKGKQLDSKYPWLKALKAAPFLLLLTAPVWATLARGGPSFALADLTLVRADGLRAARWQAGLRCLLVWVLGGIFVVGIPFLIGWLLTEWLQPAKGSATAYAIGIGCVALGVGYLLVVWLPRRSLVDRLVGTYIVPR